MADVLVSASERDAPPILQMLSHVLQAAGHRVQVELVYGAADATLPYRGRMIGLRDAVALRRAAVSSAVQWLPTVVSRARLQLVQSFNGEKRSETRGHSGVRGLFDLYCFQGPATTAPCA